MIILAIKTICQFATKGRLLESEGMVDEEKIVRTAPVYTDVPDDTAGRCICGR